jgi:hypothetical protein
MLPRNNATPAIQATPFASGMRGGLAGARLVTEFTSKDLISAFRIRFAGGAMRYARRASTDVPLSLAYEWHIVTHCIA